MIATRARTRLGNGLKRSRLERGSVLVQVAVSLTALGTFCALAVDYGVLWVARGQAQNAADAGAVAGATALAFDSALDKTTAQKVAIATADQNLVWQEAAVSTASFPTCNVPGLPTAPAGAGLATCTMVSVYRNSDHGNALPTFFARLANVTEQGVRARARATAVPANTTSCAWPLAIPDAWIDTNEGNPVGVAWQPSNTFVKYATSGPPTLAEPADEYSPPSFTAPNINDPGSGFVISTVTLNADVALSLTPAGTDPAIGGEAPDFSRPISSGQFIPVAVPRKNAGGFEDSLTSCSGIPVSIGDTLEVDDSGSFSGAAIGAATRVSEDSGASWNTSTLRIQNSCAVDSVPCARMSPRLVVLPVFDTGVYEDTRFSGTPEIRIVNFVGFFIRQVNGTAILGNMATYPGDVISSKPQVGYISSFLRAVVLFR